MDHSDLEEVIDLSGDELPTKNSKDENQRITNGVVADNAKMWHYMSQETIRGPFSLHMLKRWSDANYFYLSFTVGRIGRSQHVVDLCEVIDLSDDEFPTKNSKENDRRIANGVVADNAKI
ncbi:Uncharacterized protein Adt_44696 [Abeliophyllum distichum]|uniref:GYF domain-containing protein n=1 Tax=Abeliophyllum distichum TaxID=126358 RepID=A0ABD1PF94_9LAMI